MSYILLFSKKKHFESVDRQTVTYTDRWDQFSFPSTTEWEGIYIGNVYIQIIMLLQHLHT